MGREIRMVPPNWRHPKSDRRDGYRPMFDENYEEAKEEWINGLNEWIAGTHEDYEKHGDGCDYWEWDGNPPERDQYHVFSKEDATWFQVYETVSEGTPVSPPFATKEELAQWLSIAGDFWCQSRPDERAPTIEQARAFVNSGWGPSMLICEGRVMNSYEAAEGRD